MKTKLFFGFLFLFIFAGCQMDADLRGYQLVWSDEFDVDGAPDAAKWGFEQGFVRNGDAPGSRVNGHGLPALQYDPEHAEDQQQET